MADTVWPAATVTVSLATSSWLQRMSLDVTSLTKPLSCQFLALRTADHSGVPWTIGRVSTVGVMVSQDKNSINSTAWGTRKGVGLTVAGGGRGGQEESGKELHLDFQRNTKPTTGAHSVNEVRQQVPEDLYT